MMMLRRQQHGQPAAMMVAAGVFGVLGVFHAHVTHVVGVVGVSRMVVTISMRVRFRAARAAAIVIAESGLVVVMYRIDGNFGSIICIVGTS
ncbi:hypothetical protein [Bifidobacterium tibiigranuli]|jgi:hypothetical protein|uniref:Uncharacterized protein n=1 Tax=Bifidobacterium tibiigranuli TaxID=2172043 RepID=A0A5N6S6S7_9BIFI|nr:hypothetical protein [Bifidobacterium tibiigranuli]KAE8128693.1 hypothetical protein DDE84_04305 [Bifidobacterium tibiigranuli]KAE8128884.1 hypothetical protein DDF78_04095 [Bifidobacterium tibiigranuli]